MTRRSLDDAEKCALRDLRRERDTAADCFIVHYQSHAPTHACLHNLGTLLFGYASQSAAEPATDDTRSIARKFDQPASKLTVVWNVLSEPLALQRIVGLK